MVRLSCFCVIFAILILIVNSDDLDLEMTCFCQEMQHLVLSPIIVILVHVTETFFLI